MRSPAAPAPSEASGTDVRRRRLLWGALVGAVLLLAVLLVATLIGDTGGARQVARRWVEVNDWRVRDCTVLNLFSAGYRAEHDVSQAQCAEDPETFFRYWFMESETADSSFELVDVHVDGDSAVAEVEEVGGKVPHLLLYLLSEDDGWRIEAVGAAPPS